MAVIDGLVSYFSLDEASGDALDAHGVNDLGDTNAVGAGTGKVSGGRDFEASSSQRFALVDNTDLSMGDIDFEFAFWMKLESTPQQGIFGKWGSPQGEYAAFYNLNGDYLSWAVESGAGFTALDVTGFGAFSIGTWYFVTVGHDAAANQIFATVNAGSPETAAHSGGILDAAQPFVLGDYLNGGGAAFDGLVDEFGIWKTRTLSGAERTWLYNAGNGRSYADIVAEGGPVTLALPGVFDPDLIPVAWF